MDQPQLIVIVGKHLHRCYSFNFITKGANFSIVLYCDVNMDPARDREVAERGRRVAGRGQGRWKKNKRKIKSCSLR